MKISELLSKDKFDGQLTDIDLNEEELNEVNWKQGIAAGALALGALGSDSAHATDPAPFSPQEIQFVMAQQQTANASEDDIAKAVNAYNQSYYRNKDYMTDRAAQKKGQSASKYQFGFYVTPDQIKKYSPKQASPEEYAYLRQMVQNQFR
jgi:hypothetical protein